MKLSTVTAAVGIAFGIGIGAIAVYKNWPRPANVAVLGAPGFTPAAMNAFTPQPAVEQKPVLGALGLTKDLPQSESKAKQFELDAASIDPKRQMRAYNLAYSCLIAHMLAEPARTRHTRTPGSPDPVAYPYDAERCGDLQPGQWDNPARRLPLVIAAGKAGEPMARYMLDDEGTRFGTIDLSTPENKALMEEVRQASYRRRDPSTLMMKAKEQSDPESRLALEVASYASLHKLTKNSAPFTVEQYPQLAGALKAVPVERREAAANAGFAFANSPK